MTNILDETDIRLIVLLDDDADEAYWLQSAFSSLGKKVKLHSVTSYSELCTFLEESKELPYLIFLDIHIPKDDGIHCLEELRKQERYRSLPVVMYTHSSFPAHIEKCFSLGAAAYVEKTYSLDSLIRHVNTVMDWNLTLTSRDAFRERTLLN